MAAIIEREFKSYFKSITGYVFAAFILVFCGIYVMMINLRLGYTTFEYVLSYSCIFFIIGIPLLTMRSLAEERHQRTDQLLYSLPMGMARIVIGKYLAMVLVLAVPMAVISCYPLILSQYGAMSMKMAYGNIFGFFMLGAALISIGLFISSLTENQVVAAVLCLLVIILNYFLAGLAQYVSSTATASLIAFAAVAVLVCLVVWLLTRSLVVSGALLALLEGALLAVKLLHPGRLTGLFRAFMERLSLFEHYYSFLNGTFDYTAIVFFLTVIALFIFLTTLFMEKRRWS